MPKDNEVDEKVMPVAVVTANGYIAWLTDWLMSEDWMKSNAGDKLYSASTVAELRAKADAAERRVGELEADALELREELEESQRSYALLANESIYDGNSIGWIASKAKNYGDALLLAWGAVKEVGGTCDGNTPLHEAIRKQLTKADK